MIRKIIFCLSLCLLTVSNSTFSDTNNEVYDQGTVFKLGKVTSNPLKQHQRLKPMADYLAEQLQAAKADTVFAKDIGEMQQRMLSGDVDLFTGSAYEAAMLIKSKAGEAMALKFKEGVKEYKAIIVVRKDSGIDSLDQLKGRIIAFEDPDSTSAFRVPLIELKKAGLELAESRTRPADRKVLNYRFSGSEQNSSALLYREAVDAIALSDKDWERGDNVPRFQREQFRIIHSSPAIPRAIEVVRSSMRQETKNRLQKTLLNLHKDTDNSGIMKAYHKTSEFGSVSGETLGYLQELGNYFSK